MRTQAVQRKGFGARTAGDDVAAQKAVGLRSVGRLRQALHEVGDRGYALFDSFLRRDGDRGRSRIQVLAADVRTGDHHRLDVVGLLGRRVGLGGILSESVRAQAESGQDCRGQDQILEGAHVFTSEHGENTRLPQM